MAKQLNVSLAFNANTSQAKAQIQELQQMLNVLVKGSTAGISQSGLPLTKDLMEAQIAATKLGTILQQSLNTQTGNLDLTKFSESLNASGMKLEVLKGQLELLGPTGQKAFMSLASSIVSADVPLTRTNKLVSELWTTMKNTMRWQLTSSMLHGFMGTIQSAVGYAQDLNESLNNIRIVTGQSTEQMAAFAERANKAAKALSTTTTEYTNASLIYYQQGLNDQEVQDRTDITIKMAHASGQSAEIVSDQLTAVWNNFYDGSKSLEHYADVMTALGAATASSSDEIAGGLEKFASIADMIGLSYEYAASALATITATTRQSEEVVGTALKTIFARIQGLNLGETLDDGTTLNKYSEALQKVGISIFEQNGQLKDMDNILNDMGAKWDTLNKDQQVALAQTVAGVRQYNQLVSLMDNWDFFKSNLDIANTSDGTLQEQADIYAESWQAARDRVRAAAEDIYDSILDDKFFITVLNGFEKLLTGVGDFSDALNGLPGVLSVLSVIITKVFNNQLADSIDRIAFNLRSLSGQTQKTADELRNTAMKEASTISFNTGTAAGDLQGEQLKRRLELQNQIREVSKNMNADQKEQLTSLLQINDAYAQQAILAAEAQDKASDKAQESRGNIRTTMRKGGASETELTDGLNKVTNNMQLVNKYGLNAVDAIKKIDANFSKAASSSQGFDKEINDIVKGLNLVGRNTAAKKIEELRDKLNTGKISGAQFKTELQKIVNVQDMLDDTALTAAQKLDILKQKFNLTDAQCEEYANDLLKLAGATRTANNTNDAYAKSYENLKASISGFKGAMDNFGTSVVKGVQGISQMAMGINALVAAWDTLNNEDMSFGEKLLSVTMSLTMAIPALIGGYQALKEAKLGEAFASVKTAAAEMVDAASKAVAAGAAGTATVASGSLTFSLLAQAAAWVALKLSISPLLALLLVVAGAIAGVAVVAWGLVTVFNAIKNSTPEAKLKKAEENAKALSESLNEAKSQAQELKSVFDDYQGIIDKLKNCTKGTQEWKDALEEANAKTSELLAQYPELLSKANLFDENGILNVEVLQGALDNANEAVTALNAATLMAQADVQQAKVDIAKKDFAQDNEKYIIHTRNGSMYNYGAANKDLETLLSSYKTIGNSSLELSDAYAVLNINMDEATESEQKLANSLLNLANQSIAAANAVDNASISVINSWAKDQNIELEIGQSALMSDAYNETYESVSKAVKAASDINNKANDKDYSKLSGNLFEGTSFDGKSVTEAFNQARGANYSLARNGVRGTDNNRTYAYLENGEEKEYTIEEMQATIAASVALEKMGAAAEAASASLNSLENNVGEGIGDGIKNWLASGNFESMNKADFDKMTEGIAKDENGNYDKTALEEYLKQAFNTDDVAGLLGDDWYDRFNSAAQNFSTALDNVTANMSENAEKAYQSISNLEDLTLGDQKTLANLVQDAYINNGTEGANALVEQINNAFANGAKTEDVMEFTNVISSIDWSTASIADFRNALNNVGIDIAALGVDINTIFEAMAEGGSKSFSSIQENYKKIQDIVKDLQSGDTVSDEDYNTLVSQLGADAVDGYFSVMADGTHQLVGDAENFYRAITENSRKQMLDNISNANNLSGSLEGTSAARMNSGDISTQETSAAAVAYLQTLQLTEEETAKLAEIQDAYNQTGTYTAENIVKLNELMSEHQITEEQFKNLIEQNNATLRENSEALLSSATSLAELDGLATQVAETSGGVVYGYAEALIGLASQYDNCTQEIEAYQQALNSGNAATIEAAQSTLRAAITIGELSEKYNLVAEDVETQAKLLKENRKELDLTEEEAARLAVANQRMNRGVETLNKNFKDWKKVLNSVDHTTQDYAETLNDALDALADLTGTADAASIPLDFLDNTTAEGAKHLQWMEKAANGDVQAINLLGSALAIASVNAMQLDQSFSSAFADATNTNIDNVGNKFNELQGIVSNAMNEIHNAIQSGMSVEEIQNKINSMGTDWITALNGMAIATGMSVNDMNSLLSQLGVTAEVKTENVKQEVEVPTYDETWIPAGEKTFNYTEIGEDGKQVSHSITRPVMRKVSVPGPTIRTEGYVQVASIGTVEGGGAEVPQVSYVGTGGSRRGGGVSPSSTSGSKGSKGSKGRGGSGSGGKTSKAEPVKFTKKSDIVDRYKEQNDILDDIEKELEDINKQNDRAFGLIRLKQMDKEQASLLKQKKALEDKAKAAKDYLKIDKEALQQAAKKHGLNFKFDDEGNISNYSTELTKLYDQLHAAEVKMNGMSTKEAQDEFKESTITPIEDKIEEIKDLLNQYDETKELLEDLEDEIDDAYYAWQDSNYEELTYRLELKIDINDAELKKLDYYLNKYSDNFYKMAESAELLNKQIPELKEALSIYDDHKVKLDQAYANGEISQEAYIEGLKEVRDGYYENLEALIDLDKQMLHYYEDTLSEARSELDDFTDHMEHLTEVFDHYLNLLDILGRSKDFEAMNDFLSGKVETLRNRLDVAKEYYEMLLGQKADAEEKLNAAIAAGDDAAAELYKEEWDAIVDEVDAAQEEVLSLTEEWADAMKAVIENNMAEIADTLEKTLTGGTTFDTLMDEFDKLNTRQEEYLTKTNQIYETNKLMRTASKALDETDNKVAKQKLKNFINETKSLQENTKLSQYELEIQQAKYDLLLAEIALEEAQNAKSTVRLSRDNEGNFGYIYTADQDKIDDAQQAYEDADNRLYNLSLEGQQEFTEKYLQATQEMYNQLTELQQAWLNGEISSEEEYERRKEEILNHYLGPEGVLTTYQNLYNIAVRTDADATADNWQKDYGAMTQNTEDWKDAVNQYLIEIEDQTAQWAEVSEQANEDVEGALNDSATATEDLTDESENLKDMINEEVIPAIEDELDWVKEQTKAYADQRKELLALIDTYEGYINAIDKQIEKEAGIKYDKNTDYSALMMGYLAAGGSKDDNQFKELQKQREAKIDGEGYTKEKYGTRGSEFINNIEKNNTWYKDKDAVNKKFKELGIQTFATGGYTGDWGPEGKLAILHEKELILNAKDTENILSAISFIKDIASMIDTQAQMQSIFNMFASSGVASENRTIEQNVTIHADFPNVTDRNEIAEAFNNLLNVASQYVNRK